MRRGKEKDWSLHHQAVPSRSPDCLLTTHPSTAGHPQASLYTKSTNKNALVETRRKSGLRAYSSRWYWRQHSSTARTRASDAISWASRITADTRFTLFIPSNIAMCWGTFQPFKCVAGGKCHSPQEVTGLTPLSTRGKEFLLFKTLLNLTNSIKNKQRNFKTQ